MIIKKREDIGISNRKFCIAPSGELALKEVTVLSEGKEYVMNEYYRMQANIKLCNKAFP